MLDQHAEPRQLLLRDARRLKDSGYETHAEWQRAREAKEKAKEQALLAEMRVYIPGFGGGDFRWAVPSLSSPSASSLRR